MIDPTLMWAVGLFEGEGCITHSTTRHGKKRPKLAIAMTDKDIMQRFVDFIGYGILRERKGTNKPAYEWQTEKESEVIRILDMFLPHLGQRRAYKALNVLDHLEVSKQLSF